MTLGNRLFTRMLLACALTAPVITSGCAHPHYYRVYDPYYSDYHVWTPDEDAYYRQGLNERHYEYREFSKLNPDEQRDYWNWRHHHDQDHG